MPITVLYEGKGANGDLETELDIVAIHGLNSGNNDDHSIDTWRTPARRNGHLWLKDSLPNALPQVRTMLYNYNSNPAFGSGKDRFVREASQLLEHLAMRRAEHSDGPLILLGHSLGGILIKQALVNAHANPMHKPIIDSTFGLVFMGTPHDGQSEDAKINFGKICAKLVRQISGNEMVDLVQAVENGSLFSDILKENWRHQLENYQVISCYEVNSEVVPYDSAVLGLPGSRETVLRRNAGHSDVCRFNPKSKIDACDYELFEHNLKNMVEAALKGEREATLHVTESLRNEILDSLKHSASNPRFRNITSEHNKTLGWVWLSAAQAPKEPGPPGLVEWLGDDKETFWISGKPGAGKSTLMRYIHDNDQTMKLLNQKQQQKKPSALISFFFHALGVPSEKTFSGLLHALLYLLLLECPDLMTVIRPQFEKLRRRLTSPLKNESFWSEEELQRAFKGIQQSCYDVKVLCIVDGLDECTENKSGMLKFLEILAISPLKSHPQFKVLCSGRPEIGDEFNTGCVSSLRVQDYTSPDITKFVVDSFDATCKNLLPGESAIIMDSHELINGIVSRADGVFMWARLVVVELVLAIKKGTKGLALFQKFFELPPELEKLYEAILSKIPAEDRHHTFNHLQLLIDPTPLQWFDLKEKLCEEYPYKIISNLLGMTLGLESPTESLPTATPLLWQADHFEMCSETWRSLRHRCRGLIHLPAAVPLDSSLEQREDFCIGKVAVHKTIADSLFTPDKMKTLWADVDPNLLEGPYVQHLAFLLRLSNTKSDTQLDVLSYRQEAREDGLHRPPIIKIWMLMLSLLCLNENDQNNTPISSTWLPAFAARLFYNTDEISQLERDFSKHEQSWYGYNVLAAAPYWYSFEAHALGESEAPRSQSWQSDLLSVALTYELFSFAKEQIARKDFAEKPGRPYLHYVLAAAPRIPEAAEAALECTKLLLSKGCSPKRELSSHTTWEYLLAAMFGHRQWYEDHIFSFYCRAVLLLLDFGANPNQHVKCTPGEEDEYQGSALHILISTAEFDWPKAHSNPYIQLKPVLLKLLNRGADINAVDSEGLSVIQHAENILEEAVDLLRSPYPSLGGVMLFFNHLVHPVVFWKNIKASHLTPLEPPATESLKQIAKATEPERLDFWKGMKTTPTTPLEHPSARSLKRSAEDTESESLDSFDSFYSELATIENEAPMHSGRQHSPISFSSGEETKKKKKDKKKKRRIKKKRRRN